MKKYPLILDLETKYTFRDFDKHKKLGISVVGVYDYSHNKLECFFENELNKLFPLLETASYIIGYNIRNFDLPVLQAYYPGNITQFKTFDICDDIKEIVGKRFSLNDLVFATLGKKKSGHGLEAIEHYKNGRLEELRKYCSDDVTLTKELFDFGIKNGFINYLSSKGKSEIKVEWKKYLETSGKTDTELILPF